ncbi:response regulator [Lyngbya aestuarii]|uniref:response regulator n=1 Tax=Lyngbya aestuarii TaxID=118322 RepID=UPI00403D91E7
MPLTILVVDDNLGTRLAVSDYLELLGYSVVSADDGQQALSLIDKYHPHLIVTDINMPKMDGYELVREVRKRPEFRLLPVVFLTERNSTEERIIGYQLGCDLYLPKPFEMQELGAVIRNLLERSQMMQAEWIISSAEGRPSQHQAQPSTPHPPATPDSATTHRKENVQGKSGNSKLPALNLTTREQEVLDLLTQGLSNSDIANELYLSPRTIEKYVSNILRKTETNNRAELVRFALLFLYQ